MQLPSVSSLSGVELLEELGRDAHSVVYRARRQARYYAVKVPLYRDHGNLEGIAQNFLREATALARVRHPALPDVMEVGRTDDLPYVIMDLVGGETLAARIRKTPLKEVQVIEIGLQLAD